MANKQWVKIVSDVAIFYLYICNFTRCFCYDKSIIKSKLFGVVAPSNVAISVKSLLTKMKTSLAAGTPNSFNFIVPKLKEFS